MSLDQVSESDTLPGEQLMLPDKPVHVHQLSVDHTLQPNARVVDKDLAACHSGSQVVASRPEHRCRAPGHVLAGMFAHAFDDCNRAAVAEWEGKNSNR